MSAIGFLETAALEAVAIFGTVPRNIGGIKLQVTVQETGTDEMEVTSHPVEQSAAISDHAFKKPARVTIKGGVSDSSLSAIGGTISNLLAGGSLQDALASDHAVDIYNKLLALQATADLFTVVTGKRTYKNMLMVSLTQDTEKRYETTLMVTCVFQELILVQTSVTAVAPPASQADPASNSGVSNTGTQTLGPAPNYNAAAAPAGAP